MPRKGSKLSPEAAAKNAAATAAWHKENTSVIKFSVRVPAGSESAYKELAARRGTSLTAIVREYLNAECRKEGIQL